MTPSSLICPLVRGRNLLRGDFIRIVFVGFHIIITSVVLQSSRTYNVYQVASMRKDDPLSPGRLRTRLAEPFLDQNFANCFAKAPRSVFLTPQNEQSLIGVCHSTRTIRFSTFSTYVRGSSLSELGIKTTRPHPLSVVGVNEIHEASNFMRIFCLLTYVQHRAILHSGALTFHAPYAPVGLARSLECWVGFISYITQGSSSIQDCLAIRR